MTGSGISVDGYDIVVCGGRDVAGGPTGGMAITFGNGATYSELSDQPGTYDGAGCFFYHGYLEAHPITYVSVPGIGDWSGSNWWVDDPPLPPEPDPEPEPEPVPPPNPPSEPADSPVSGSSGELVMPDFSPEPLEAPVETPNPSPTPSPSPTKTATVTVTPVRVPEAESDDGFVLDPVAAVIGTLALAAAGGATYLTVRKRK